MKDEYANDQYFTDKAQKAKEEGMKQGKKEGMEQGKKEGMKQGIEEGQQKQRTLIAQALLELDQLSPEVIAEKTGLSLIEVQALTES
jgi:flagellar biosynthesis/type III secretory pathway protein FliH